MVYWLGRNHDITSKMKNAFCCLCVLGVYRSLRHFNRLVAQREKAGVWGECFTAHIQITLMHLNLSNQIIPANTVFFFYFCVYFRKKKQSNIKKKGQRKWMRKGEIWVKARKISKQWKLFKSLFLLQKSLIVKWCNSNWHWNSLEFCFR